MAKGIPKYPWDEWAAELRLGRMLHLCRPVDFEVEPYVFGQQVRNYFTRYNKARRPRSRLSISVQIDADCVTLSKRKKRRKK
jgi:hypothetical protein